MNVSLIHVSGIKKKSDLFIIPVFEDEKKLKSPVTQIEPEAVHFYNRLIKDNRFQGKFGEEFPSFGEDRYQSAKDILFVGLGKESLFDSKKLRQLIGKLVAKAKSVRAKSAIIPLDALASSKLKLRAVAGTVSEIVHLADYRFDEYLEKKKDETKDSLSDILLVYMSRNDRKLLEDEVANHRLIANAANFTRMLINQPANVLTPRALADHARSLDGKNGLRVKIFDLAEIKRRKMNGVLAVSQGSKEPPYFVVMEYGASHKSQGTTCLVGKGVIFDSGGISIKPSKDMGKMKYDMSGAAVVIGTMKVLSELKIRAHVVGLTPLVENMPSGTAQRPGDIIRYKNGKSVEVINTDAEGRLILADALIHACEEYEPKTLIDLATLTGACLVALGDQCAGLMGNDQKLIDRLRTAGEESGERLWQLPMWPEYLDGIKGQHADLLNAGPGYAGTVTAAKFLEQFVTCKSWAHLDIAGVSWTDKGNAYYTKGATGFGVRLLCQFLGSKRVA